MKNNCCSRDKRGSNVDIQSRWPEAPFKDNGGGGEGISPPKSMQVFGSACPFDLNKHPLIYVINLTKIRSI